MFIVHCFFFMTVGMTGRRDICACIPPHPANHGTGGVCEAVAGRGGGSAGAPLARLEMPQPPLYWLTSRHTNPLSLALQVRLGPAWSHHQRRTHPPIPSPCLPCRRGSARQRLLTRCRAPPTHAARCLDSPPLYLSTSLPRAPPTHASHNRLTMPRPFCSHPFAPPLPPHSERYDTARHGSTVWGNSPTCRRSIRPCSRPTRRCTASCASWKISTRRCWRGPSCEAGEGPAVRRVRAQL